MQTKSNAPPITSEAWPNWYANEFGVSLQEATERQTSRQSLIEVVVGRLMNRCSTETIPGISIIIGETEVSYIAAEKPPVKEEKEQAGMTTKTVERTLTPLEQENLALDFFELKFSTNPRKLVQLAKRMYPTQPDFVQQGLLTCVIAVKDPVNYLRRCFALREQFVKAIDEFSAQGYHGMMVVGDNIYPLSIEASKNWLRPNDRWNYDEELDIQDKLINEWMNSYGIRQVKDAKIVLFTHFGFSGIPRGWAWEI